MGRSAAYLSWFREDLGIHAGWIGLRHANRAFKGVACMDFPEMLGSYRAIQDHPAKAQALMATHPQADR